MADLKSKKAVEIFSVGVWNGTEITLEDLDEMITAWTENPNYQLPLKLGHDKNQKLLQNDGMPAAGWIDRIYRTGNKLMADFKDIPAKIYQLIENKAYKQVSSEVFFNVRVGEKKYKKMLAGVALLGADVPGVMNLNDMLAMYGHKDYESLHTIVVDNKTDGLETQIFLKESEAPVAKTENEVKLETELALEKANFTKVQDEVKAAKEKAEALEKEAADLREFKANAEVEKQKLMAEKAESERQAKVAQFIADLKTAKLCSPAMQPLVEALLGEEYQVYTCTINKEEKKFESKQDLLKECLQLFAAAASVNFEENSEDGKDAATKPTEEDIVKKAEEYAKEKKVDFKTALRAIRQEQTEA